MKPLYPLFQGWTDSWRVKSLPCCGDNYMDMVKISNGLVVQEGFLTKEADTLLGGSD